MQLSLSMVDQHALARLRTHKQIHLKLIEKQRATHHSSSASAYLSPLPSQMYPEVWTDVCL